MSNVYWGSYPFQVCLYHLAWRKDAKGIYIFCGLNPQGQWVPLYIGQAADSFHSRIPGHEKWTLAVLRGATHVHAMVVAQASRLGEIERELIRMYQPVLNVQHKGWIRG